MTCGRRSNVGTLVALIKAGVDKDVEDTRRELAELEEKRKRPLRDPVNDPDYRPREE